MTKDLKSFSNDFLLSLCKFWPPQSIGSRTTRESGCCFGCWPGRSGSLEPSHGDTVPARRMKSEVTLPCWTGTRHHNTAPLCFLPTQKSVNNFPTKVISHFSTCKFKLIKVYPDNEVQGQECYTYRTLRCWQGRDRIYEIKGDFMEIGKGAPKIQEMLYHHAEKENL